MCIAVYKKEGMRLTDDTLQNCWNNNPHGAGFMYAENDKLTIVKGLMTYADFLEAYRPHEDKQMVLHFRIRTHGETNPENTHPFSINEDLALVHNGIMSNVVCDINPAMSDTWHFVERYMKAMSPLWQTEQFKDLVESFIGHSKLIMMNNKGEVEIYKSELGNWSAGCWFSNTSWKPPVVYPPAKYVPPQKKESVVDTSGRKPLTAGSICWLMSDTPVLYPVLEGEMMPKHTQVRVSYFAQNNCVGVVSTTKPGVTARVPVWQLLTENPNKKTNVLEFKAHTFKFMDEAVVKQDHNGLIAGTIVTILNAGDTYCIVEELDSMLEKKCSIPSTLLAPVETLFH